MQLHPLGMVDYLSAYEAMRNFTARRLATTPDEMWICEHPSVFTMGIAGSADHVLTASGIPIVRTDRGGQVTYHGPGQVVIYPLLDLRRRSLFVKEYVYRLEEAAIRTLCDFGVTGHRIVGAPGVYVRLADPFSHRRLPLITTISSVPPASAAKSNPCFEGLGKIAALGLKVRRNCVYHGISFNANMNLTPFEHIHPCGYSELSSTDLSMLGINVDSEDVAKSLSAHLSSILVG